MFVAPGALGLGLGVWLGRDVQLGAIWPFAVALCLGAGALLWVSRGRGSPRAPRASVEAPPLAIGAGAWIVGLLLFSIAIRSFVGMAGCHACPKSPLIRLGLPLVAFFGKAVGGFLADRFGWRRAAVGALLVSAPLVAFGGPQPALILFGLLVFQTTMPVTLVAVFRVMPRHPATAFGVACVALVLGALPTFSAWATLIYEPLVFLGLVLVSAAALYLALGAARRACGWLGDGPLARG
jgi:FSR family fosmidomycin resistance protein-like MFS transporter